MVQHERGRSGEKKEGKTGSPVEKGREISLWRGMRYFSRPEDGFGCQQICLLQNEISVTFCNKVEIPMPGVNEVCSCFFAGKSFISERKQVSPCHHCYNDILPNTLCIGPPGPASIMSISLTKIESFWIFAAGTRFSCNRGGLLLYI